MGATVTCNKKVGAFVRDNGQIIYILFEETYEKNCYPHTPSWCADQMGDLQATMRRIFAMGAACEGGGLQGKGGEILPESYIGGWLEALANPHVYEPQTVVALQIGGSFYSLPEGKKEEIVAAVDATGDHSGAKQLAEGQVVHRQVGSDTVIAIMALGISAWRIGIKARDCAALYASHLAYRPTSAKSPMQLPKLAHSPIGDGETLYLEDTPGKWVDAGRMYRMVGSFVGNLWENELQYPGSYKSLIKAMRANGKAAPTLQGTAVVELVPPNDGTYPYQQEAFDKVMNCLGVTAPCRISLGYVQERLASSGNTPYWFNCLGEAGMMHIETPNGNADMQKAPDPVKAEKGLIVTFGEYEYELESKLKQGWQVKRCLDGTRFRMTAKQIKLALEALPKAIRRMTAMPSEQVALF